MGEWGSYCTNTTPQTIWVSNVPPPVALRGWLKCTVRFYCIAFYKHLFFFAVEGYSKIGLVVHQYYTDWFENDISSQCYHWKQTSFCLSQCSATFNEMAFLTAQSSFKFYINNYLTSSWGIILLLLSAQSQRALTMLPINTTGEFFLPPSAQDFACSTHNHLWVNRRAAACTRRRQKDMPPI